MSEGNVYLCKWHRKQRQYHLWLESDPSLRAVAETFAEAYEVLWAKVFERYNDGEACLEFAQGLPRERLVGALGHKHLIEVFGNTREDTSCDFADLFTNGICDKCKRPLGPRNNTPLSLSEVPTDDGFFVAQGSVILFCFSERFVREVASVGLSATAFRECITSSKRKVWYELVGEPKCSTVAVKVLGVADKKYSRRSLLSGWVCAVCGARSFYYIHPDLGLRHYVAEADLGRPIPPVAIVHTSGSNELCLSQAAWMKLSKHKWRNVLSCPMQIVQMDQVERAPRLRDYGESLTG